MEVRAALAAAARQLDGISATPRLDAELLMAKALGMEREAMLLSSLDQQAPAEFQALLERRIRCEPIAYILGRRHFWTIELEVGPGVLVPRPDSETLIEAAIAHCADAGPNRVLDLGTGSGALLLAALDHWKQASGLGVDASDRALAVARRNAERLGLAARAAFVRGDWAEGIGERFDLILCNPPYISEDEVLPPDVALWEPTSALRAGPDGLRDYRRLAPDLPRLLAPGGIACLEIGSTQADAVSALLAPHGSVAGVRKDLAGRPRCVLFRAA